ncbi:MAG TPA: hypothetical protein VG711_04485 [Phycisphaerales bacterium]|nr:hypothetical protein [Phycisphaerales bacterium]
MLRIAMPDTSHPKSNTPPIDVSGYQLALKNAPHTWIFRWEPGDEDALMRHIARAARDADTPLDWPTAALACKQILHMTSPPTSDVRPPAS